MRWLKIIIPIIVIIVGAYAGWYFKWSIFDWYRLLNYKPAPNISALAQETTMTPYAKRLFYAYHPQLDNAKQFNSKCNVKPQVIVLGCTVLGQGIYIYNVTDPNVNGIVQVTSAYEMLHVGYSMLSAQERAKVDAMVMSAYTSLETKYPFLQAEEQSYLATEGSAAVPNELHSMLGTEVSDLPKNLANYYKRYFINRQTVVNFENMYQGAFLKRQQQVAADDNQLEIWQQQIDGNENTLTSEQQQIQAQFNQLQQLQASGQIQAYNAAVPGYNQVIDNYNSLVEQTRQLINEYNDLVVQRNQITLQVNNLYQAISSLPNTITQAR